MSNGSPTLGDLEALASPLADGGTEALRPLQELGARLWATRRVRGTWRGRADSVPDLGLSHDAQSPSAVADQLDRGLAIGLNPSSPLHFGWIPGGSVAAAAAGDWIAALANTYAGYRVPSPAAVQIERVLLDWMAEVVGLPSAANGDLTAGGSLANAIALQAATPRVTRKLEGQRADLAVLPEDLRCSVFVSEERHRCIDKALAFIGHGGRTHTVPVDASGRMKTDALAAAIAHDRREGGLPWLVVASAGTTSTGAIDPLLPIASVCAKEGLWLHVDAAVGGFFALSSEGRKRLAGLALADSVVLDPHKGLFMPYGLGAVLLRDGRRLLAAHSVHHAYIREDCVDSLDLHALRQDDSPMYRSPELSRPFRALRMWTALQVHGTGAFAAAVGHKLGLAARAWTALSAAPAIEVGPPPDLCVVTFRVRGEERGDERRQEALVSWLRDEADVFVTSTVFAGRTWLRLAVLCLQTKTADLDAAVTAILRGVRCIMQLPPAPPEGGRRR